MDLFHATTHLYENKHCKQLLLLEKCFLHLTLLNILFQSVSLKNFSKNTRKLFLYAYKHNS